MNTMNFDNITDVNPIIYNACMTVIEKSKELDEKMKSSTIVWYKTQNEAFSNYRNDCAIIACDLKNNEQCKKYTIMEYEKIEMFVSETPEHQRNYHELICMTENIQFPVKWYIDYDHDAYLDDLMKNAIVNNLITDFQKGFEKLNVSVNRDNFVVLNSSNTDKTSFHIILNGYHFKNVLVAQHLMKTAFKSIFDNYESLDKAVYGKNRCFRMPNCSKKGSDRVLSILSDHTFNDALLTYITPDSILIEDAENYKVPKQPRRTNYEIDILNTIESVLRDQLNDHTSMYCREQSKPNNYYFKTKGERKCPHGLTHKQDNFVIRHDPEECTLTYVCLSSECASVNTVISKINGTTIVEDNFLDELGVKTDQEAAETLYKLYPHWVFCCNTLYVFDDKSGIWSDKPVVHNSIVERFKEHLHVVTWNAKTMEWKVSVKSYGNDVTLMKKIFPFLQILCIDDEWKKRTCLSAKGKLLFKNGIMNMETGKFSYEFDPNIVFRHNINMHYDVDHIDQDYINNIYHRLFVMPLGDNMAKWTLTNFARALSGEMMKRFIFGIGLGNSGKSSLASAFLSAFGSWVGTFNAENMSYKDSSSDSAAELRWALLLCDKRLLFSNEIKSDVLLNGNMLKKFSSGGDMLIGRTHCKEEEEFLFQGLLCIMANDINKIKPCDDAILNRARVISYEKVFSTNPSTPFELKADENFKTEINSDDFKIALVHLVLQRYREFVDIENKVEYEPPEVKEYVEDWIGNNDELNYMSLFLEHQFEITNNPNDYIRSDLIDSWLKGKDLGISLQKFISELKRYCTCRGHDKVKRIVKSIKNKNTRVWVGIKNVFDQLPLNDQSFP